MPGFFHLFDKDNRYLYAHGTPLSSIMFPFRYVQLTIDSSRGDKAKFKFGEPDKNGVRQLFVYLPDEQDRGWRLQIWMHFLFQVPFLVTTLIPQTDFSKYKHGAC